MSEWQPIETVPKDERWIMLYRPKGKIGDCDRIVIGFWHDGFLAWPDSIFDIFDGDKDHLIETESIFVDNSFTHWMPLPEPPK